MATQAISHTGATYAAPGYVAVGPQRAMSSAIPALLPQGITLGAVLRSITETGIAPSHATFAPGANERPSSLALATLSANSFVSFLNLRILSQPFTSSSWTSFVRETPKRRLSPGYEVLVPQPVVPPVPPDVTAPAVGNFVPAPGTAIGRATPVTFNVTDESGQFRRVFVVASFAATGVCEVIHDGDTFRGFYVGNSSRVLIALGFRYTVARTSGWPSAPTIQTFAIDAGGNEAN